jgi:hypothetical protein
MKNLSEYCPLLSLNSHSAAWLYKTAAPVRICLVNLSGWRPARPALLRMSLQRRFSLLRGRIKTVCRPVRPPRVPLFCKAE